MARCAGILSLAGVCLAAMWALPGGDAWAQSVARRDPTQPPPVYGAQPRSLRDPIDGFRPDHLVSVDGRRYLMWQGRRYAVGDSVQGARIERIEDTEVWLRTEQGLRKLKVFEGVEKNNRERMK